MGSSLRRAAAVGLVLLLGAVAGTATAWASQVGPWKRATHNGYTICGSGYTYPHPGPSPEYVYGLGTTSTYSGNSCGSTPVAGASMKVSASLLGNPGTGWVACGPTYTRGYESTGSTAVNSWNTYCRSVHQSYTQLSVHGGWITGTEFPTDHLPIATPPQNF